MKTKQIIFAALIFIFSVSLISAQDKITVTKLTDTQKHQRVIWQLNHTAIIGFKYAKSQGMTAKEYGEYFGEFSKLTWDKDGGFDGFVKGLLLNWETWRASSSKAIQIIKQTDDIFKFKTPSNLKKITESNAYIGIDYEELMTIYDGLFKTIANYLGVKYEQKIIEDGNWLEITITK